MCSDLVFQMLGMGIQHFCFYCIYAFVQCFSSFPMPPCIFKVQATSRAIADTHRVCAGLPGFSSVVGLGEIPV